MKLYDQNSKNTLLYAITLPLLMFMPFGISALLPKNSNRSVGEADAGIVIVVFANFILVPVIFGLGTLILASLKVSSPSKKAIIAACAFTVVATAYMLTSL